VVVSGCQCLLVVASGCELLEVVVVSFCLCGCEWLQVVFSG
jgi:hypothetical protein